MTLSAADIIVRYPSTGRLRELPHMPRHIMIIDDDAKYPHLLQANLNILHNYAAEITILTSLGRALDVIRRDQPDLLFVAEWLRPCTTFGQMRRYLAQAGYDGPIVACVNTSTGEKRQRLSADGATYILNRDETHTTSLIDVITATLERAMRAS
jgi:CheY-like chemotaxis protein